MVLKNFPNIGLSKLGNLGHVDAVPLAPSLQSVHQFQLPQLANPVGHQETTDPQDNSYFNGPQFPPGFGMASSPDFDARREFVNNQLQRNIQDQNAARGISPELVNSVAKGLGKLK